MKNLLFFALGAITVIMMSFGGKQATVAPSGEIFAVYQTSSYWANDIRNIANRLAQEKVTGIGVPATAADQKRVSFAKLILSGDKKALGFLVAFWSTPAKLQNPCDYPTQKAQTEADMYQYYDEFALIYQ